MQLNATTYTPGATMAHRADARVKIVLVLMYSATLFGLSTWWGMGVATVAIAVVAAGARLDFGAAAKQLVPVWVLLFITFLANACTWDVTAIQAAQATGLQVVGSLEPFEAPLAQLPPVALVGSFGIVPAGCARGVFYVLRIVDLVAASLVLTTTTSSTDLSRALRSLLSPLGRIGAPVHDIATIVSIALRFIPVTLDEFHQVKNAQTSRGARFSSGGIGVRMRALQTALIPWFVGLYRRASQLAQAMDARCYGMANATQLDPRPFSAQSAGALAAGGCAVVVLAIVG